MRCSFVRFPCSFPACPLTPISGPTPCPCPATPANPGCLFLSPNTSTTLDTVTMTHCAGFEASAVTVRGGASLHVRDSTFANSTRHLSSATFYMGGGCLAADEGNSSISVVLSNFTNCECLACNGGAIAVLNTQLTLDTVRITGGISTRPKGSSSWLGYGGAVVSSGSDISVAKSLVQANTADCKSCVYVCVCACVGASPRLEHNWCAFNFHACCAC